MMNFKKTIRLCIGLVTMVLGLALMLGAVYIADESALSRTSKHVAATASALSGGALTFVVSRRLLTTEE